MADRGVTLYKLKKDLMALKKDLKAARVTVEKHMESSIEKGTQAANRTTSPRRLLPVVPWIPLGMTSEGSSGTPLR